MCVADDLREALAVVAGWVEKRGDGRIQGFPGANLTPQSSGPPRTLRFITNKIASVHFAVLFRNLQFLRQCILFALAKVRGTAASISARRSSSIVVISNARRGRAE
jgi:hypothetical protein